MVKLFFFCFVAVLLILFNKAALSSYGFPCANVITLFQVKIKNFITSIILFVHVFCIIVLELSCILSSVDDKFLYLSLCTETVEDDILRKQ